MRVDEMTKEWKVVSRWWITYPEGCFAGKASRKRFVDAVVFAQGSATEEHVKEIGTGPVSYTHLTLPTIRLV